MSYEQHVRIIVSLSARINIQSHKLDIHNKVEVEESTVAEFP